MRIRYLITAAALLFISTSLGCLGSAKMKERPPKSVKTKIVETASTGSSQRYAASIKPTTQVELSFKVGGYVEAIPQVRGADGRWRYLQEGDTVSKGALLARIRPGDYAAKVDQSKAQLLESQAALEATKEQIKEAESGVETSKQQIAEAEAAFEKARLDWERAQKLFEVQSLTKSDYDAAKAQYDGAKAKLDGAKSQYAAMRSKLSGAQSGLRQASARIKLAQASSTEAAIPLEDTALRAPMSGVILQRKIEVGTLVSPGTQGFTLADTTFVKAVIGVPDLSVGKLKLGTSLPIITDAIPGEEFRGHITSISPTADPNSRLFNVEVTIPNPLNRLKSGMIASLQIGDAAPVSQLTVVPLTAIVKSKADADSYGIFVVEEQSGKQIARLRNVTLGETLGNNVAIANGLKAGERIITTGAPLVTDGEAVQVIP